jgi:SAM-dependent methyltransferase
MRYFEYIPIDADDQTIACHPFIDACNARILFHVLRTLGCNLDGLTGIDVGAGTGQVSRLLLGLPGIKVEALDPDPEAARYFGQHPELVDVPFHQIDLPSGALPKLYDLAVARGVYHHIPKKDRPLFLRSLCNHARVVIIADEGLQEYSTPVERQAHCDTWYGYVISEARRRGLTRLAEMESHFHEHERLETADDGLDFKESPTHLVGDSRAACLPDPLIDRLGPWNSLGGGFFVAVFVSNALR